MRVKRDCGVGFEEVRIEVVVLNLDFFADGLQNKDSVADGWYVSKLEHMAGRRQLMMAGTALLAAPLYAATYSKMHDDGPDALKYEPAVLASVLVVGLNFHHAVSSARMVPTAGVIAAAGVGMYYFKSWRYTRAYLGKNWKAYLS